MVGVLGGELVGMSTALETVAARAAGLEVLGLSLVTNLAAGTTGETLDHQEVLQAGRDAAERCGRLLAEVVDRVSRVVSDAPGAARAGRRDPADPAGRRPGPGAARRRRGVGGHRRRPRRRHRDAGRSPTARAGRWRRCGTPGPARCSSARPACAGAMGPGPQPDEPLRRRPRRRRARRLPARPRRRGRRRPAAGRGPPRRPLVVVGHDARHRSHAFATDSAAVLTAAGCRVVLLPGRAAHARCSPTRSAASAPTPASWSPRATTPRTTTATRSTWAAASSPGPGRACRSSRPRTPTSPPGSPRAPAPVDVPRAADGWEVADASLVDGYVDAVVGAAAARPPRAARGHHGHARRRPGRAGAGSWPGPGVTDVTPVPEQAEPDPDFPTVPFPNPEEAGRARPRRSPWPPGPAPTSWSPSTPTPTAAASPCPTPPAAPPTTRPAGGS